MSKHPPRSHHLLPTVGGILVSKDPPRSHHLLPTAGGILVFKDPPGSHHLLPTVGGILVSKEGGGAKLSSASGTLTALARVRRCKVQPRPHHLRQEQLPKQSTHVQVASVGFPSTTRAIYQQFPLFSCRYKPCNPERRTLCLTYFLNLHFLKLP